MIRGFTLTEVLVAVAGMTVIALGASGLVQITMNAQASEERSAEIYRQAFLAMERMTSGVRKSTFLLIPNNHSTARQILAFSGTYNDDDDYYFDHKDFPRIDEDVDKDMTDDGKPGISGYDDDGDGTVDEAVDKEEDEEMTVKNEERLDGEDDDGDGNVDEDLDHDMSVDTKAGWRYIDDDGDGSVDEGSHEDDDEDGDNNEDPLNPIIYEYNSKDSILIETFPQTGAVDTLCTQVEDFLVTYYPRNSWYYPRIYIKLRIMGDDGEIVEFGEWVYPENTVQRCGKRVK